MSTGRDEVLPPGFGMFLLSRLPMVPLLKMSDVRLRKHAEYQRVYRSSRKQFSRQVSYFFLLRCHAGGDLADVKPAVPDMPRVGLTVGKVMGKAVDRNRIKRRVREAVRSNLALLRSPVDVILHPRRSVIDLDFILLCREVAGIFETIQQQVDRKNRADRRSNSSHPRSAQAKAQ